ARGHDVLDETHLLAFVERALEPVAGAVGLRFLAHDQERKPARERGRRGERDGTELRAGNPDRLRRVLRDRRREPLAERTPRLGTRLEPVLVEVVARALPRAQDEVALEVRVLPERGR